MNALLMVNNQQDSKDAYYRCPECYTMFRPITVFEEWDYYDCIPRVCPNCCKPFDNGLKKID